MDGAERPHGRRPGRTHQGLSDQLTEFLTTSKASLLEQIGREKALSDDLVNALKASRRVQAALELTVASTREIRRRIKSIKSTAQITKAMQMVAASKMRKAQSGYRRASVHPHGIASSAGP